MEIFLTFLKGLGIFAAFIPFGLYMLVGLGNGDISDISDKAKNGNIFLKIYMYYYPLIVGVAIVISLLVFSIYIMGKSI
jgi:hypothetical protein